MKLKSNLQQNLHRINHLKRSSRCQKKENWWKVDTITGAKKNSIYPWRAWLLQLCRPGVLGVTELSRHLSPTPWGAILQICFIWDLYKLTRSLPDNNPCYWMWLMLAETRRMWVRVTGKGGRDRKLIFITPEKLLMMRDTRYLTRDGHQLTIMSHGSHTCHEVTMSWGNIFIIPCGLISNQKLLNEYFYAQERQGYIFISSLLHVLIRSPKFFKRTEYYFWWLV